jgi:23S rRNA (adenine2503-C2)-methyltransferase
MGMGEPLLNIENVVEAVRIINKDLGIGARNITISTVGVKGQISALAKHKLQTILAVSLHAPAQDLRCNAVSTGVSYADLSILVHSHLNNESIDKICYGILR